MNAEIESPSSIVDREAFEVRLHSGDRIDDRLGPLVDLISSRPGVPLSYHPAWPGVLAKGLGHVPYRLVATGPSGILGHLPLCFVSSPIFGRYLVSLPYLNYGGVMAEDPEVAARLIDSAVELAGRLNVKYLELRHEAKVDHPALGHAMTEKVQMRMPLPSTRDGLWDAFTPKVRNQVRKGQKHDLEIAWGGEEMLGQFHEVFSRNMRDLGTPGYGKRLFRSIVRQFPDRAEFCVVRAGGSPLAAALLLHGWGVTEVPSASSLRSHNHTNANMLMYYELLCRSIERGQRFFDFGRSSRDSNTFRFKSQWGAVPSGSTWQYCLRRGGLKDARPDNPRYQRMIRIWQRLPVAVTRVIGPMIVRGIP
jgi:FemAB-related protein (PEP-CTERM system-associated)